MCIIMVISSFIFEHLISCFVYLFSNVNHLQHRQVAEYFGIDT